MAKEAERLLADTRWLPEPLRLSEVQAPSDVTDGPAESLPEFLAVDGGQSSDAGENEPTQVVAAE
jgi:ParB family transcriptional regulator, chromosome partitioning protein